MSELANPLDAVLPRLQFGDHDDAVEYTENPRDAANAAVVSDLKHSHRVRDRKINGLVRRLGETPVLCRLQDTMRRSFHAGEVMAIVGYNNFRHLIAGGFTLPEVADALDINVLDLAYFLSQHDSTGDNMELDNTLCADTQSQTLYEQLDTMLENDGNPSKEQVSVMQLKLQLIERRNARLSDRWGGIDGRNNTMLDGEAARIVIMMGAAPTPESYQNNPRVINAESNSISRVKDELPLDEKGQLIIG